LYFTPTGLLKLGLAVLPARPRPDNRAKIAEKEAMAARNDW